MSSAPMAALAGLLVVTGLVVAVAGARGDITLVPRGRAKALMRFSDRRLQARLAASVATSLVTLVLIGWPIAAIIAGLAAYFVPALLSGRTARRRVERLSGIESWVRQLSDGLSGNSGLEEVLLLSAEHPPAALAPEIRALAQRLRLGVPIDEALRAFSDDVDHELCDVAVGALTFAAEARGPGLRAVLTDLARTIARSVETEQQVDAERATHRITVKGVIVAIILFGVGAMFNRDYVQPFGTVAGQAVLGFIAVLWAVAVHWMYRLAHPGAGYRFLRASRQS